jgi:hypothetical protein
MNITYNRNEVHHDELLLRDQQHDISGYGRTNIQAIAPTRQAG